MLSWNRLKHQTSPRAAFWGRRNHEAVIADSVVGNTSSTGRLAARFQLPRVKVGACAQLHNLARGGAGRGW